MKTSLIKIYKKMHDMTMYQANSAVLISCIFFFAFHKEATPMAEWTSTLRNA